MKKWIRGIVFVGILAAVLIRIYNILAWKDTAGDYVSSIQQLYNTEEELIDVVFVGSSHVYCGINPVLLWADYGISAFDMSISGQDKNTAYHNIVELLKTQSPQVVCVDLYALTYDEGVVLGNLYRALLSMDISLNSVELIQKEVEEESWMDYILRWPIIHTRYQELERYDFEQYAYSLFGRGELMSWETSACEPVSGELLNNTQAGVLSDANLEWLESLVELSQTEGFELIFFMAPFYYDDAEIRELCNAAKEFAAGYGIAYFDFNELAEEIGLNYGTDFIDTSHCNANGARKLTEFFGAYFAENMELEDHRGDTRYYLWYEDLEYYQSLEQEQQLAAALNSSVEEYAEQITSGSNLSYVLTLNGDYLRYLDDIALLLEPLGINVYEYQNGGKWIYADGELTFIMDNTSLDSYTFDLDDFVTVRIENVSLTDADATVFDDVRINGEAQESFYDGAYIMVYDSVLHRFVSTLGWN